MSSRCGVHDPCCKLTWIDVSLQSGLPAQDEALLIVAHYKVNDSTWLSCLTLPLQSLLATLTLSA